MTKPKQAAAPGPRFDPSRRYSVQLNQVVEWPPGSGRKLSPAIETELRGDVAEQLQAAIASAELVPEPPKPQEA